MPVARISAVVQAAHRPGLHLFRLCFIKPSPTRHQTRPLGSISAYHNACPLYDPSPACMLELNSPLLRHHKKGAAIGLDCMMFPSAKDGKC